MSSPKITFAYSSHLGEEYDVQFEKSILNNCGIDPKNVEIKRVENMNQYSLHEIYTKALNESGNDIVVFSHNDIELSKNWARYIIKHFERSDYGILGVAGTDYLQNNGVWWARRENMWGIVDHDIDHKLHTNAYSKDFGKEIKDVVTIDGVFFAVSKQRLSSTNFQENTFKGFHFYEIPFCVENFINNTKVGVIYDVRVCHKSGGQTNEEWEDNRKIFVEKYKDVLPLQTKEPEMYDTFVMIHDQDLLLELIANGKYKNLENPKFIFVGNRNCDKIRERKDVVIARELRHNIEEYNNFTAFTGWYAIWKNKLSPRGNVLLLEYDVDIEPTFRPYNRFFTKNNHGFVGYIPFSMHNNFFIESVEHNRGIFEVISKLWKTDVYSVFKLMIDNHPQKDTLVWPSTSNCYMRRDVFNKWMEYFEATIPYMKEDPMAGHGYERAISYFLLLMNSPHMKPNPNVNKETFEMIKKVQTANNFISSVVYLVDVIKHHQLDSHQTQGHETDVIKFANGE